MSNAVAMPSIQAHISTSSPVFDLTSSAPFTISIDLFLQHLCELTFPKFASTLFNSSIFNEGGLTFTDTSTGIDVPRGRLELCAWDHDGALRKENEQCFMTLRPGQKHTITAEMARIETRVKGSVEIGPITTVEEHAAAMEKLPKVWKWRHARKLEDGKTYRVGIDQDASIKQWLEGSKQELLSKPLADRREGKMCTEPVQFHVVQPACFTVQRPDTDGSLDWP
ncbi:hypothetical protein FALBO_7235 [Fusarium albosuccineum]|uniref:Uncharacterized protein n=1 Tax=Fusarium albosuccineum TaxID=1237068 RepID=A0A8H4LBU1_9HYPO|nr:hypothetical protein FALBO_7235 [Fusarium albosuccineum]